MPILQSGKKAVRQSTRRRTVNDKRRRAVKETIKTLETMTSSGDVKNAQEHLSKVYKAIDKATKRGVLKKNTASRRKSKAARAIVNAQKTAA